jgi:hypothetical protein
MGRDLVMVFPSSMDLDIKEENMAVSISQGEERCQVN